MTQIAFIFSCILNYGSAMPVSSHCIPANISRPELFGFEHLTLYENIKSRYTGPGEENIVTSPLVFDIGMGLLRYGAPEICEKYISTPGMSDGDTNNLTVALDKIAKIKRSFTIIKLSNLILLDVQYTLKNHYLVSRLQTLYQTNLYQVDFVNNSALIEEQINEQVSEDTHNLINEVLSPGSLSSDTQAVIINTIYFEANWTTPFEKFESKTFNGKTKCSPVTMLSGRDYYGIITLADGRKLIRKEYYSDPSELSKSKDDKFWFVVSEGELPLSDIPNLMRGAKQEHKYLRLIMPKIKQTTDLNVLDKFHKETKCLKSLGLTRFTEKLINILSVKQKNRFETTLIGSKGASVFTSFGFKHLHPENVEDLLIDKPFNYYVIHKESGAVLFAGSYIEPDTTIDAIDG